MSISLQTGLRNAQTLMHSLKVDNLPEELFELQEIMLMEQPNMVTIAEIISKNPELLGDFLATCNQTLHRDTDNPILDARAAVNILGLQEIEHLFLASYLNKKLPKSKSDLELIQRSKRAAIAASEMTYWINNLHTTETYLVTFMQDVGAIYLARHHDTKIKTYIEQQSAHPFSSYQLELADYQTAHTYLGSLIAHQWHLGPLLSKSILMHHTQTIERLQVYDPRLANLVALIQLANAMVTDVFAQHNQTTELAESFERARTYLKLPDPAIRAGYSALEKWGVHCTHHYASH